ncbi:DUF4932 domain-containing protein [Riemerella anatipestifer]|uniref:DUF4932 domain-containing protein n=1 Tax=Riemerella anatipestifer TaxID=34085 RepID=A0AAP6HIX7_RIEAN|nr:DUF4932 domain-containing protein [Riemerella anatipestifer]MCO7355892.1 DUF4932 domain-containing protein [Riemerella anatipestifer]MCU7541381.1 DUF4932 domain-containing protein [Riemerella anatipestifer]MCU7571605.1 DUF4932 domain-containing protein [Riemerella anatipestifer]MCU7598727.1 DUF4932 domain-containing protein [Riemerella anatipestifer]MCW0495558.1 DUF4932 domain-containing protein [Riemerella anatipestifer]
MNRILTLLSFLIFTNLCFSQTKGIEKNVNFTKNYISKHKGKTTINIPEVSELVNIIMALHKDAEKDNNMFDTKTDYYKEVKNYFAPYRTHPILDTIQKYISDIKYYDQYGANMFSRESYGYYYALKMNACTYEFSNDGKIKNNGTVKEVAKGWYMFDPMKDIKLFEDFARKSNFRKFYKNHKNYYNGLITTYNQLNPVQKMQKWLDNKFGFGYGSYAIYFSPLVNGAHSTQRFEDNGFTQTMMFINRAELDKEYSKTINELLESRVVFTEIDHNYVNPVSDRHLEKIKYSFSNLEKWAMSDVLTTYNSAYKVFNEYMTFAVYSLYILDNYKEDEFKEYLPMLEKKMVEQRKFIKFKEFNRTFIEKYRLNKNIKPDELYIYMLNWAENINKK